jgi:hypothetical protein
VAAVGVGISEDGTAEIGMGAGLPAGGLYTDRKRKQERTQGGSARAECERVIAIERRRARPKRRPRALIKCVRIRVGTAAL